MTTRLWVGGSTYLCGVTEHNECHETVSYPVLEGKEATAASQRQKEIKENTIMSATKIGLRGLQIFLRWANRLISGLIRMGVNLGETVLLRVPGRKTGEPRTTPVTVLESDGVRVIQSPYGTTDWVRNLRASGMAQLVRGRQVEEIQATELTAEQAAPIYMNHLSRFPAPVRSQFDIHPDANLDAFIRVAENHPMFRVDPIEATVCGVQTRDRSQP